MGTRFLAGRSAGLVAVAVLMAAAGCSGQPDAAPTLQPEPAPTSTSPGAPSATSASIPTSGLELDRVLRARQSDGKSSLPALGSLLAAGESGGSSRTSVDTRGFTGKIIGVFVCEGASGGLRVELEDQRRSMLMFGADGCDPQNLYSGMSQRIGTVDGKARLSVTPGDDVRYAFVLEEVAG